MELIIVHTVLEQIQVLHFYFMQLVAYGVICNQGASHDILISIIKINVIRIIGDANALILKYNLLLMDIVTKIKHNSRYVTHIR